MQSLSQKCCPSADACTDGMPTECSTECQETLDSVLGAVHVPIHVHEERFLRTGRGYCWGAIVTEVGYLAGSCKKVLSAQPAAMQAKLTTFSQKCVDSNDIDNGDGYGDPDDYTPDQECAAVGDCPVGSYCDARPACYDCNFIDVSPQRAKWRTEGSSGGRTDQGWIFCYRWPTATRWVETAAAQTF